VGRLGRLGGDLFRLDLLRLDAFRLGARPLRRRLLDDVRFGSRWRRFLDDGRWFLDGRPTGAGGVSSGAGVGSGCGSGAATGCGVSTICSDFMAGPSLPRPSSSTAAPAASTPNVATPAAIIGARRFAGAISPDSSASVDVDFGRLSARTGGGNVSLPVPA